MSAQEQAHGDALESAREQERLLIGALISRPYLVPEFKERFNSGAAFWDSRARTVYQALTQLGESATFAALVQHLGPRIEGIGGAAFLSELQDRGAELTAAQIEGTAERIVSAAQQRELVRIATVHLQALKDGADPEQARAALTHAWAQIDAQGGANSPNGIAPITAEEVLDLKRPPLEFVLEPIIKCKGIVMTHSLRGIGKTQLNLGMASAIAAGGRFLDWTAPKPRPVLYVDGELPIEVLQERLRAVRTACKHEWNGRLQILAADMFDRGLPNLAEPEGQRAIEGHLDGIEALFLDNLSTLCRGGVENDAESWEVMQDWLLRLRRRGLTSHLVHHSGKGGMQRGTSKREDILDLVLTLKRPADYHPEEGCRFEVHFEKSRGLTGEATRPIEARLETCPFEGLTWTTRRLEVALQVRVLELAGQGLNHREIAQEVGRHKSTITRILQAANQRGDLS